MISTSFTLSISSISLIPLSISFWRLASYAFASSSLISLSAFALSIFFLKSCLILRIPTFHSSLSRLAILTRSRRRSSVRGGILIMRDSPLLDGLSPIFASLMPFSISFMRVLSHGCITIVLASITDTAAIFLRGPRAQYAITYTSSTIAGFARQAWSFASSDFM